MTGSTLQGHNIATVPTTIVVTNTLAPNKAPMPIRTSTPVEKDVTDENTSGDPFPMAKNVTPAT
jgi:hypothetical protein